MYVCIIFTELTEVNCFFPWPNFHASPVVTGRQVVSRDRWLAARNSEERAREVWDTRDQRRWAPLVFQNAGGTPWWTRVLGQSLGKCWENAGKMLKHGE